MKLIKIYLVVATCMLIAALAAGVYVWYVFQSVRTSDTSVVTPESEVQTLSEQGLEQGETHDVQVSTTPSTPEVLPAEPVVIDVTKLTDAQREILASFGYGGDSITISEAVVRCAEEALGTTRFNEVLNGAAPTPLEALSLVPCMKR